MESDTNRFKMFAKLQESRNQLQGDTVQKFVAEMQLQSQIYKVNEEFGPEFLT